MLRKAALALGASLLMAGSFSLTCNAQAKDDDQSGAKGLFFEQMQKPESTINTGLQYWIELNRHGAVRRVSNKETFYSGDRIRFHVCANIDGYAYILLRSGSRGEQSVLFPDHTGETNKVKRGHDYELPGDGYLAFDQNPGTEKLTLLLSRNPIDAEGFLAKPTEEPTMIASSGTGSKDLIPAQVLVVYSTKPTAPVPKPSTTESDPPGTKGGIIPISIVHKPHAKTQLAQQPHPKARGFKPGDQEEAVTTVVHKAPTGVLFIDVALNHN